MPAGHTANAAYWFYGQNEGVFISSTFYMDDLPNWVRKFNREGRVEKYLTEWNTLYNIKSYTESGDDLNQFEGGFYGKETAEFPYDLAALKDSNGFFDMINSTPFA